MIFLSSHCIFLDHPFQVPLMHLYTLLSIVVALVSVPLITADENTTINSSANWGIWEGWGVSLAWWAKEFGTRSDLASAVFSTATTSVGGTSLPGLGLNIARYNAGACSTHSVNGTSMVLPSTMNPSREMDAYWIDWSSTDPSSSSWTWSVDASQREMLQLAKSHGANIFELFSNSPVWWMCYNHNPAGSSGGSSDNLQSWNYDQHAVYLATIAEYAKTNWGITFTSVEPFNEPSSDWWNGNSGTQEGCHFDASTQATVIPYLRTELNNRGLSSTIISASDENTYDIAVSTFNSLGSTALADVGRINVHGYQYGDGSRDGLYSLVSKAGKKLWNSEYGDSDGTGQQLVSNLILDFRWLHQTAWVYWQIVDVSGWGLLTGDDTSGTISGPAQKYFILAQFTRHIRPGMQILDAGCDYAVAAYDSTNKKLIVVAVNWGSAQYLNFDLSKFKTPGTNGALVPRWSTQIGSGDRYASYNDTFMSGTKFWSHFNTNQVQTFEVSNVSM
jgi:galactan endo-1,6-beta-galactosidase